MPDIETACRHQTAVLWPATGEANDYGEALTSDPVELSVRWETRRREAADAAGNTLMLDATAVVDRQVAVGGVMWLGELADWYGTGSAGGDDELMRVALYNEVPDVKGRAVRRTVGLQRYRDTTPPRA